MGPETNSANNEPRGIVAVGASAGGVEALTNMAAGMPRDFPFAVVVVLHMPPGAPSVLAKILDRSGPLPACSAVNGMRLKPGQIHVAVPDHHLLIEDHRAVLSAGPTENGYRPAINALFRSAALAYGPRAIGLLLSGVLDDGVLGAAAIRSRGGVTLVQHPNDALYAAMPLNAVEAGVVDHQVTAAGAGQLLMQLVDRPPEDEPVGRDANMELENRIARAKRFSTSFDTEDLGPPSGYVCPDCNGSLQSVAEGNFRNFRCQTGHAWTGEALLRARDEDVDSALWIALRSLQEKAKLARRMADNFGPGVLGERYGALADETERAVKVLGERLMAADSETGERGAG